MKRLLLFFLLIIAGINVFGQKNVSLTFILSDSLNTSRDFLNKLISSKEIYRDTFEISRQIQTTLNKLREEGFLATGLDSLTETNQNYIAYLYAGEKYQWGKIRLSTVPEEFLQGTGIRKNSFSGKPINYNQIASFNKKLLRNCENNGYPFAFVKLDSIEIIENSFSAALLLEKNKFIHIDSIIIKGTSTIAPVYIYNYISIKPGDVYKESQLKKITSRMRELSFLKEVRPSQVLFTDKETKLYLFLENKKASQFDGVIGFLPDESNKGKLNVTGEVHLKLINSLKRGEIIELNWKQLPAKSQDLKVHSYFPFLFNTPFGLDGNLAIYKKDTTYIDVTKNLGVQYAITGNNFIKAFYNNKQSDLQSAKGLENITLLPDYADITTVSYGFTIHNEKLDYRLNPREGYSIETTGSTGNRKIRKNSQINPVAYESIDLNSVTYHGEVFADYYYSPGGRNVFNPGIQSAIIYNPQLFVNELYRIGGLKSLRGFDEESIYASKYIIGKIEYRYLLEQNSFLFTFFNMAWYKNESRNNNINDHPYGFGAGINFETKIGIMSVSYALGKQFDNPILFRNGKIHFGIVNYF